MQVMDALSCVGTHVRDHSPAGPIDPLCLGQMFRHLEDLGQQFAVAVMDGLRRLDVFLRDDEDMRWGAGIDVPERHDIVRGVKHIGLDLLRCDPAEQTVLHAAIISPSGRTPPAREWRPP